MRQLIRSFAAVFAVGFLAPSLATAGWWAMSDRPGTWRTADWSSSCLLPPPAADDTAAIHVLAARTGGLKGAFAVHSWIVLKRPGAEAYERYDKVGWGRPIRRDGYPADGRWYSNEPFVVHSLLGEDAGLLIPRFEAAIASYPHAEPGSYRSWPGPNSNTFVAHVLAAVPEFGGRLPAHAVGRDYAAGGGLASFSRDGRAIRATIGGLAGFSFGLADGIEIHLGGLVAGVDPIRPGLKVPALGELGWRTRD